MPIDSSYLLHTLRRLIETPSPVGFTGDGTALCHQLLCDLSNAFGGLEISTTRKGVLVCSIEGRKSDAPRAVTSHIDTLGAVVKRVKDNGRLQMAQLGTFAWTAIENEGVTVVTHAGARWRGTVMIEDASHHLYAAGNGPNDLKRSAENVCVRLDARTTNGAQTAALGIGPGDVVHFDPRYEESGGFIRSRFLDNKGGLAAVLAALKSLADAGELPAQRTTIHIPNYEEAGHGGASGMPDSVQDVLAIDIAPVGSSSNCDEYSCALCVADEDGPYDSTLGRELRRLADANGIALKTDVYTHYDSDGGALWRAGADVRVALIGPGVEATHGYERTHIDALSATAELVAAWIRS